LFFDFFLDYDEAAVVPSLAKLTGELPELNRAVLFCILNFLHEICERETPENNNRVTVRKSVARIFTPVILKSKSESKSEDEIFSLERIVEKMILHYHQLFSKGQEGKLSVTHPVSMLS
jgi:hypothetical protein